MLNTLFKRREFVLLLILAFLIILFSLFIPTFRTLYNLSSSTVYSVTLGLLGLGEFFVILSGNGGIDLSIGSILSMSAMTVGTLIGRHGWNITPAVLVAIFVGGLAGLFNGILISIFELPALMVTLATMYLYSSVALALSFVRVYGAFGNPMPISNFPDSFFFMGQSTILGIPFQVVVFLIPIFIISYIVMGHTTFGQQIYALGSGDKVSVYTGIPVKKIRISVYVISGLLAGLAAVIMTSHIASSRPDLGVGYNLLAITIAVLGGVDIFGGRGTIVGLILADAIVTVLYNALQLVNTNSLWQDGVLGMILIGGAIINNLGTIKHMFHGKSETG